MQVKLEGTPDGEDAALRYPEIAEPRLYRKRASFTQVFLLTHPGRAGLYRPDEYGVGDKPLEVGRSAR